MPNESTPRSTQESSSGTTGASETPSGTAEDEVTLADMLKSARSIARASEAVYKECCDSEELTDDHKARLKRRWLVRKKTAELLHKLLHGDDEEVCGLCGHPGADKVPHPVYWPGEKVPHSKYVHAACEEEESARAMSRMTLDERRAFLQSLHNS